MQLFQILARVKLGNREDSWGRTSNYMEAWPSTYIYIFAWVGSELQVQEGDGTETWVSSFIAFWSKYFRQTH